MLCYIRFIHYTAQYNEKLPYFFCYLCCGVRTDREQSETADGKKLPKSAEMQAKIIAGKLNKRLAELCLVTQVCMVFRDALQIHWLTDLLTVCSNISCFDRLTQTYHWLKYNNTLILCTKVICERNSRYTYYTNLFSCKFTPIINIYYTSRRIPLCINYQLLCEYRLPTAYLTCVIW